MVVNGNKLLLYAEGVAIGCLTNCTFTSNNEEIETTCKDDDGNYTSQSGSNRWSMTGEGNFNPASNMGVAELLAIHTAKEVIQVVLRDTTVGSENLNISGDARLDQFELTGGLNEAATYSFTLNGQGAYTITNT